MELFMRLEEIIQILEFTDTDTLEQALNDFNTHGFVEQALLPFMNVVFEQAPVQLCSKLEQVGFHGNPAIIRINPESQGGSYIVYDTTRYCADEVQKQIAVNSAE
ncbi:hypothetical protein DI392_06540 [Vibrio albus]|uniref:Uncharacterized protein n=2 Tax=Vibrio albus TaxID=2200953 RepID=A0A2U3BAV0_9VIBR|nr:hypothetical protein DI392_06540 [Vibrio albus]